MILLSLPSSVPKARLQLTLLTYEKNTVSWFCCAELPRDEVTCCDTIDCFSETAICTIVSLSLP